MYFIISLTSVIFMLAAASLQATRLTSDHGELSCQFECARSPWGEDRSRQTKKGHRKGLLRDDIRDGAPFGGNKDMGEVTAHSIYGYMLVT